MVRSGIEVGTQRWLISLSGLEFLKVRDWFFSDLFLHITSPIRIEHHKVVVLWHVLVQSIVLTQERDKQITGPIVSQLFWRDSFVLKHKLEKGLAMAASLYAFVDVEIKNASWFDFLDLTVSIPDE